MGVSALEYLRVGVGVFLLARRSETAGQRDSPEATKDQLSLADVFEKISRRDPARLCAISAPTMWETGVAIVGGLEQKYRGICSAGVWLPRSMWERRPGGSTGLPCVSHVALIVTTPRGIMR